MPNFKYITRTRQGEMEIGLLEAKNEEELVDILQGRGLIVISYEPALRMQVKSKRGKKLHTKVKSDDLIVFARQLSTLIKAGITLLRSLEILCDQVDSKNLYTAISEIKKDVSSGSSLKDAMSKHSKIFSKFWINIIATGEATGQLGSAIEQMAQYLENSEAFKRKIIGALMYPAVILTVAIAAILVFILKIIPMFQGIYLSFGAELPGFTKVIFGMAEVVKKYFLIVIGAIVGIVFLFRSYRMTRIGKRNIDKFVLDSPLAGNLVRQMEAVKFSSGLGMLIKSGTPILHALDIMIESAGNVIIADVLTEVKENVRVGKAMATPMIETKVFPELLSHMVSVGEESGELAEILQKAAVFYQDRVDASVSRLTTLFEPMLIVFIGGIVGTLIIAMYLPIFGLANAVK